MYFSAMYRSRWYRKAFLSWGCKTTMRWQKQVFIHTWLSRDYLALAMLISCISFIGQCITPQKQVSVSYPYCFNGVSFPIPRLAKRFLIVLAAASHVCGSSCIACALTKDRIRPSSVTDRSVISDHHHWWSTLRRRRITRCWQRRYVKCDPLVMRFETTPKCVTVRIPLC